MKGKEKCRDMDLLSTSVENRHHCNEDISLIQFAFKGMLMNSANLRNNP